MCLAITVAGKQCKRNALDDSDYCAQHQSSGHGRSRARSNSRSRSDARSNSRSRSRARSNSSGRSNSRSRSRESSESRSPSPESRSPSPESRSPSPKPPSDDATMKQLRDYLDKLNMEYDSKARKADLLKLVTPQRQENKMQNTSNVPDAPGNAPKISHGGQYGLARKNYAVGTENFKQSRAEHMKEKELGEKYNAEQTEIADKKKNDQSNKLKNVDSRLQQGEKRATATRSYGRVV